MLEPFLWSRASRSCGLKSVGITGAAGFARVTSFTLVWIKIALTIAFSGYAIVTSFTLVWIKIKIAKIMN